MNAIVRAFALLDGPERRQLIWLVPGIVAAAILKVVGIAALAPFLQVVLRPESIHEDEWLTRAYLLLGMNSDAEFLYLLGLAVLVLLTLGNGVAMLVEWLLLRFSWMRNHSISQRLLDTYLAQPYSFSLGRNSSDLSKNMLSEVQGVVQGIVVPALQALSNAVTAVLVVALLVLMDPWLAVMITSLFGALYVGIYFMVRRRLGRLGEERSEANRERFIAAAEALGAFKEIKLLNIAGRASSRYAASSSQYSKHMASSDIVSQTPRFALETIAFGGLILVILYLLRTGSNIHDVVPMLGVYAFAGYRLLPALQQIYLATSKAHFNLAALETVTRDLALPVVVTESRPVTVGPSKLLDRISLEDLSYAYPGSAQQVLRRVSLTINAGASVALVGTTGSGKTTLVDLLMGLLPPSSGRIAIDGEELTSFNAAAWQSQIGYVQQSIFLADTTIAKNIAFGREDGEPDMERVINAARTAQLYDFVTQELPQGFETLVGERGVRLSGGQRQRIGIARALYANPKVLILDEATSALDGATESTVFESLASGDGTRTVVMIAHRLTTVRDCDQILVMENGQIVDRGTYQELLRSSRAFQNLAQVQQSDGLVLSTGA